MTSPVTSRHSANFPYSNNPSTASNLPVRMFSSSMILPMLLLLGVLLMANSYIKVLYQKELKTHAALSLELNRQLQEEQNLLAQLHSIKTYPASHPLSQLEQQVEFQRNWKKVKLLHIPVVTIDETPSEFLTTNSLQAISFNER